MTVIIGRRELLAALGGAVATWPLAARAQQPAMPVIGFLNGQTAAGFAYLADAFRQGLVQAGYVEGQNVAIEYRWADGQADRLPALADDLVRRRVAVLVATGGSHFAATAATTTIPIVCAIGADPVKQGFAVSLNRPGGNVTGMSVFTADLEAKRLELLHELVAKAASLGVLLDPKFQMGTADLQSQEVQAAARKLGREVRIVNTSSESEIDAAFASLVDMRVGGLLVMGSPVFLNRRDRLLALTARHALPAIYENREFTRAGGLMSYGTSVPDVYRQIGIYAGRILKGEKPAELPFLQPTKFDIAVNLKTAKALGLEMPTTILLRADEVIE
jgi:putative tryptophan/tyrosine transport system substrate-binding protein